MILVFPNSMWLFKYYICEYYTCELLLQETKSDMNLCTKTFENIFFCTVCNLPTKNQQLSYIKLYAHFCISIIFFFYENRMVKSSQTPWTRNAFATFQPWSKHKGTMATILAQMKKDKYVQVCIPPKIRLLWRWNLISNQV